MEKKKSIKDLLIEFFKENQNKDMSHGPVVDWVEEKYLKLYYTVRAKGIMKKYIKD